MLRTCGLREGRREGGKGGGTRREGGGKEEGMREGGWVGGRDRCRLTHIFAHIAISAAPDTDFLTCISVLRLAVPFDLHICRHGPRARAPWPARPSRRTSGRPSRRGCATRTRAPSPVRGQESGDTKERLENRWDEASGMREHAWTVGWGVLQGLFANTVSKAAESRKQQKGAGRPASISAQLAGVRAPVRLAGRRSESDPATFSP